MGPLVSRVVADPDAVQIYPGNREEPERPSAKEAPDLSVPKIAAALLIMPFFNDRQPGPGGCLRTIET
jgi:hypothetical protein